MRPALSDNMATDRGAWLPPNMVDWVALACQLLLGLTLLGLLLVGVLEAVLYARGAHLI